MNLNLYSMIVKYFRNYLAKIKETKKIAREKNVSLWVMPVFDSVMVAIIIAWYLALGTWMLLGDWQDGQVYSPSYMDLLWEISAYSPLIYFVIITTTVLDKMILFFIHIHAFINNLVFRMVNKLDHWIWKKTGKDSVVSNVFWKIQVKFYRMSIQKRRRLMMCLFAVMIFFYSYRFAT